MDDSQKRAARAILVVFRDRDVGAGGFLHFDEFGKALKVEAGYVKHENQREALNYLKEKGYVNERDAGLELTDKGAASLAKL